MRPTPVRLGAVLALLLVGLSACDLARGGENVVRVYVQKTSEDAH